jgi:uncharacterized membrane protein
MPECGLGRALRVRYRAKRSVCYVLLFREGRGLLFFAFVAIGLLSIIPTLEFLSWRKPLKAGQPPQPAARKIKLIGAVLRGELIGVAIILLCAAIMARGGFV